MKRATPSALKERAKLIKAILQGYGLDHRSRVPWKRVFEEHPDWGQALGRGNVRAFALTLSHAKRLIDSDPEFAHLKAQKEANPKHCVARLLPAVREPEPIAAKPVNGASHELPEEVRPCQCPGCGMVWFHPPQGTRVNLEMLIRAYRIGVKHAKV